MPLTFYPLSLRKKNSTVVWIRDHLCGRFEVWFSVSQPSALPLKDKNFQQNYQHDTFYSSVVNGSWRLWDVHCAPNIAEFYYSNENGAVKVWSRLIVHLHIVCSFLTIHRLGQLKKHHAHRSKVIQFFLRLPLCVKWTVFVTFMILLRWRKRLNTTGNWSRLVNSTEIHFKQNN